MDCFERWRWVGIERTRRGEDFNTERKKGKRGGRLKATLEEVIHLDFIQRHDETPALFSASSPLISRLLLLLQILHNPRQNLKLSKIPNRRRIMTLPRRARPVRIPFPLQRIHLLIKPVPNRVRTNGELVRVVTVEFHKLRLCSFRKGKILRFPDPRKSFEN